MSQPPPRKGAYTKHICTLHKDQFVRVQNKNNHELELLEDIQGYMKKRAAVEKTYGEALLKLSSQYQNHKILPIPDIGNPPQKPPSQEPESFDKVEDDSKLEYREANVFTIWRQILDENEKIAKARLAAVQVFVDDVEKEAKFQKVQKNTKTKKCLERLQNIQKDLQASVSEVFMNFLQK